MNDTVELYRDAGGEWRWRRRSENGRILADSGEGYQNRADCEDMARRVNGDIVALEIAAGDPSGLGGDTP